MIKEKVTKWEPDNFELKPNTVWSFPDRGNWATHNGKYRGNWWQLVAIYTKKLDFALL